MRFVANMKIPTYYNFSKFNFMDILQALCKHVFSVDFTAKKISKDKKLIVPEREYRETLETLESEMEKA